MIGKTISHYKILEKLGEGGMGVVYKAKDTKLERTVALKFLSLTSFGDEEKKRFKQEAKAAAALNHPNIATIHAIDEVEDQTFIAMEFIEGQSVEEILSGGSPMKIEDAIDYATQTAAGLQAAHEKGIVHCDINSANIMITEKDQVKIMDFGLAKVGGSRGILDAIVGTPAYMSPEQARGEEVDHRTDIWSFGVVLYEMLTGQLPFKGNYIQAVIYSIMIENPQPMNELRQDVSVQLAEVVEIALEKEPDARYQSMTDLLHALHEQHRVSFELPQTEKSIVVLPFENVSSDRENEYFSDGLTEEIISDLSNIKALRVISRTSAMRFKGTDKDIKTIGKELQVNYVLEGSVRKANDNLRITAQLIHASTDAHLWAEKYRGTLEDVFDIQEKVARSIVQALKLKLAPTENEKLAKHPIEDVRAYDYYFRARQEILKGTPESLKNALRLIHNSMDIEGESPLLLFAKGYIHWMYYNSGIESNERHLNAAERLARKIFKLEPESAHGYLLLGLVEGHRGNIKEAVRNLERNLQLDPNDLDGLGWLTVLYAMRGRTTDARRLVQRLIKMDPLTAINYLFAFWPARMEGKFDEVVQLSKIAYESEPDNPSYLFHYFYGLALKKNHRLASSLLQKPKDTMSDNFFLQLMNFLNYALTNKREKALQLVTKEFRNIVRNDVDYSSILAEGFALLNRKDEALDWLENAVNLGLINYPYFAKHAPFLENIRGSERFYKLISKVKTEWEKAVSEE